MNFKTKKTIWITIGIAILGLFGINSVTNDRIFGALPVYQNFQLQSPLGYGLVFSNGVATSTLTSTSSPTVSTLIATSSIRVIGESAGCAQFNASGVISSIGSNCITSGTGRLVDYYGATTSVGNFPTDNSGSPKAATTTGISSGQSLMIWASCGLHTGVDDTDFKLYLQVGNPGGGTTTLSSGELVANTAADDGMLQLHGLYTATTTGNAFIAVNKTGNAIQTCFSQNITYIRFGN